MCTYTAVFFTLRALRQNAHNFFLNKYITMDININVKVASVAERKKKPLFSLLLNVVFGGLLVADEETFCCLLAPCEILVVATDGLQHTS